MGSSLSPIVENLFIIYLQEVAEQYGPTTFIFSSYGYINNQN